MENSQTEDINSGKPAQKDNPNNEAGSLTPDKNVPKKLSEADKKALLEKEIKRLKGKLTEMDDDENDDFYDLRGI